MNILSSPSSRLADLPRIRCAILVGWDPLAEAIGVRFISSLSFSIRAYAQATNQKQGHKRGGTTQQQQKNDIATNQIKTARSAKEIGKERRNKGDTQPVAICEAINLSLESPLAIPPLNLKLSKLP